MSTKRTKPLFAGIFSAFAVTVMMALQGCMDQANGSAGADSAAEQQEEAAAIPVEAATVSLGDVAAFYSGTATLEAEQRAEVVSEITGVVFEVVAEEGDFVETGDVLARVETDRYKLEVDRANAALKRLKTDFRRKQELFEKQLVSAEVFEQVSAEYEAQIAEHELALLNLRHTEIRAPISGYVAQRMIRLGNLVELYQPVYSIASYDPLLAVLHVPERELSVLRKGQKVVIQLDAWAGEEFTGEVIRISPVVDPQTGTFRVTSEIEDSGGKLRPGLFGRVNVHYDLRQSVPVVPRDAVLTEDEESHVFVINETGNAQRRPIVLGYEQKGRIEVIEGLTAGERVVTAGKGSLSDGARVEIVGGSGNLPKKA